MSRLKWIIAAAVVTALAIAAFAAILVPDLNPMDYIFLKRTEHSARFYPEDTFLYAYATLYPRGSQRKNMEDLWDRFNENRTFRNEIEDAREEWEDETGINLEEDIRPWLGPDLSAGIVRFDSNDDPIAVATVSVLDRQPAEIFLDQLTDYLEDSSGASFVGGTYQNYPTWIDEVSGYGYALTDDLLIAAFAEEELQDTLEEMLELATQESGPNLAGTQRFQEAMKELPGRRFASAYMNIEDYHYVVTDDPDFENLLPDGFTDEDVFPWASVAFQWEQRAVRTTTILQTRDSVRYVDLTRPSERLPENTMAYLAVSDDFDMDQWRELWERYPTPQEYASSSPLNQLDFNPMPLLRTSGLGTTETESDQYMDELLDQALDGFEDLTGIDPETEVLDFLGPDIIMAIEAFDIGEFGDNPDVNPLYITVSIGHDEGREADLEASLREIANSLEEKVNIDQDPVNVGADSPARVIDLSDSIVPMRAYAPGYVLHDSYLTFGTTEEALENIVSVQKGEAPALRSNREYQRAMDLLPRRREAEAWIDLNTIVKGMDPGENLTRNEYRLITTATGTAAASNHKDGDKEIIVTVMTFFPERGTKSNR